jgi:hypothetical protein
VAKLKKDQKDIDMVSHKNPVDAPSFGNGVRSQRVARERLAVHIFGAVNLIFAGMGI